MKKTMTTEEIKSRLTAYDIVYGLQLAAFKSTEDGSDIIWSLLRRISRHLKADLVNDLMGDN